MKKTKNFIVALSILCLACIGGAFVNTGALKASAETTLENNASGIMMAEGASVRYVTTAEDTSETSYADNGLRFEMLLTTEAYENIKDGYDRATFGILIAPASYEETIAPLDEAHVFEEEKVYNWAVWEDGAYKYYGTENGKYTRIVNVSTTVDFTAETVVDLKQTTLKDENGEDVTYYHYYGSITGINPNNISREFVGVGYVEAGSSEDPDRVFAARNDNVRSVAYVAQKAIADASEDNPVDDNGKTWLQNNYLSEVSDEDTTYTVKCTVPSNVSGGTAVVERQVTAKIGETIDLEALPLDGYTYSNASASFETVLANGKTVVEATCEYATTVKVELQSDPSQYYLYNGGVMFYLTEGTTSFANGASGVFVNATDQEVTVNVGAKSGVAAIVDKNGIVIEGRDGYNGKLMNAENPARASGAALDSSSFGQGMVIPVGGFAIVAHQASVGGSNLTYGVSSTDDIRLFMLNKIISNYGNCVRISLTGTNVAFTEYQSTGLQVNTPSAVELNVKYDQAMWDSAVLLEGITVTSDKGTFETSDDGEIEAVYTVDASELDVTKAGTYSVGIKAADGSGNETEFTRTVTVNDVIVVTVGDAEFTVETANSATLGTGAGKDICEIAIDNSDGTGASYTSGFTKPAFRLYTQEYAKNNTDISYMNGYGAAVILDENGKVVRAYEAGGACYYFDGNEIVSTTWTNGSMGNVYNVLAGLTGGNYYLLITPHDGLENSAEGGSRYFLRNIIQNTATHGVGLTVEISYYDFD